MSDRQRVVVVTGGAAGIGAAIAESLGRTAASWQLGRHAPEGVVINAISPIAATRMVAAALGHGQKTSHAATGGLSLGSMPAPEHLGPLGAHLVDDTFTSCQGRVLFVGGCEVAVIDEPRLIDGAQRRRALTGPRHQRRDQPSPSHRPRPTRSAVAAATPDSDRLSTRRPPATFRPRPRVRALS